MYSSLFNNINIVESVSVGWRSRISLVLTSWSGIYIELNGKRLGEKALWDDLNLILINLEDIQQYGLCEK